MIIDFMLTPVWDAIRDISGNTFDPSLYTPTSGFSTINGSAITEGGNLVIEGGADLDGYWTSAETKDYVDSAVSGIDLSNYYTKAETDSAITAVEDHLYDVEEVTASALTELHDSVLELSARTVDLSGYYTSAQTEDAISAATSGKADKTYVDSAITEVQDQIDTMDDVVSAALVDLNTRKVESTSVSTIWKGTQAEYDAATQSGATANPATLYIIVNNS